MNEPSEIQSESNRLWAVVGKIGVIVGVIAGIHAVYKLVKPDGPSLVAECSETEFAISPDIKAALTKLAAFPEDKLLYSALTNSINAFPKGTQISDTLVNSLSFNLREHKYNNPAFEPRIWGYVTFLTLENQGNKTAQELVVPFDKTCGDTLVSVSHDGNTKLEKNLTSLKIASLRPGGRADITIWSAYTSLPYADTAVVAHSEGTSHIERSQRISGIGRRIGEFVNYCVAHPFLSLFLFVALLSQITPTAILIAKLAGYKKATRDGKSLDKARSTSKKTEEKQKI